MSRTPKAPKRHSPAPWSLSNGTIYDRNGVRPVADLCSQPQALANGRLIEAAPALLQSLKEQECPSCSVELSEPINKPGSEDCCEDCAGYRYLIAAIEGRDP